MRCICANLYGTHTFHSDAGRKLVTHHNVTSVFVTSLPSRRVCDVPTELFVCVCVCLCFTATPRASEIACVCVCVCGVKLSHTFCLHRTAKTGFGAASLRTAANPATSSYIKPHDQLVPDAAADDDDDERSRSAI